MAAKSEEDKERDAENDKEFYDACETLSENETKRRKPNKRERRFAKRSNKTMFKLRNGKQIQIELNLSPKQLVGKSNELTMNDVIGLNNIETVQEEDNGDNHMPISQGKSQYLNWAGASDCIKDQVSGCYLTQIFELDACKPKPKPKRKLQGHLKKKQKLKVTNKGKGKDKDMSVRVGN